MVRKLAKSTFLTSLPAESSFFMTKIFTHKDGSEVSEATKIALLNSEPFFSYFEVVEVNSEGDYK